MLSTVCFVLCVSVAFSLPAGQNARTEDICHDKPDGAIPGWGCKGFTRCKGGQGEQVDCTPNVFNETTGSCDLIENVQPPCGILQDCSGKDDGRYVETHPDHYCRAYYTCLDGQFRGHNPCPGDLVFDEVEEVCNWKHDVPPPCGTKV